MQIRLFLLVMLATLQGCGGGSSSAPAQPVATSPTVTTAPAAPATPTAPDPLANLKQAIKLAGKGTPVSLTVVGFGSSVGVGATLPDPATQAPVMYLSRKIQALSGVLQVTAYNRSVNGSVVSQMINDPPRSGYWQSFADEGKHAQLVVFAYGMNDGFPSSFNAGQTLPFVYTRLVEAIKLAQASGAEVIVMTTPHPLSTVSWAMPAGIPQVYPSYVAPDVAPEAMSPAASQSEIQKDGIMVSARHLQVNEAMRKAAVDTGAALIDVEPMWFQAVQDLHGDATLFDSGEVVHPNLLGHQLSYQRAIDAFVAKLGTN
jgi:lysophospholipase L1-like esterase